MPPQPSASPHPMPAQSGVQPALESLESLPEPLPEPQSEGHAVSWQLWSLPQVMWQFTEIR